MTNHEDDRAAYMPTEDEIREACQRIQDSWTPRQREIRAGSGKAVQWSPSVAKIETEGPAADLRDDDSFGGLT